MKYSSIPTYIGAAIIFLFQLFIETEKMATNATVYFVGVVILTSISITISTAKDKQP